MIKLEKTKQISAYYLVDFYFKTEYYENAAT
jgi:hypothetical protein